MGLEEAGALAAAERGLEQAMTPEGVNTGKAGWRSRSIEVTTRLLDSSHPTFPGQTHRTAILN